MASRELIGAFLAKKWKTQAKDVILPEPGCPLSACTSALLVLLLSTQELGAQVYFSGNS